MRIWRPRVQHLLGNLALAIERFSVAEEHGDLPLRSGGNQDGVDRGRTQELPVDMIVHPKLEIGTIRGAFATSEN